MTEIMQEPQSNVMTIFGIMLSTIKKVIIISVFIIPVLIKCFIDIFVDKKTVSGWTVLISGGVDGIGKYIADEFAKRGCNIAILDIDGEVARKTAMELRKYNIKAFGYQVDVCNAKSIEHIKALIETDIAPVDILVNSTDIVLPNHALDETDKNIKRATSANMNSQFYTTRTFLPGMIERKRGHIVTVSPMSAHHASAYSLLQCSTMFGANGFALALEEELRQQGVADYIKCTILYPFFVERRNDIYEWANFLFPELDPADAANAAVNGILKNRREVYIHCIFRPLTKLGQLMPYGIIALFRSYILQEKEIYKRLVGKYLMRSELDTVKVVKYLKIR